jgi:hypothetical protein
MRELGDYSSTATIGFDWNTYASTGASITRNVNGLITIFEATSTLGSTVGLVDTEDYRGVTGVHNVASTLYVLGREYSVVLTNSSIGSETVNACLARFGIRARYRSRLDSHLIKGASINDFPIFMRDSTSRAPALAQALTVTISLDDGAYSAAASSAAEIGNGNYSIDLSSTETNAKKVAVRATSPTCDDFNATIFPDP